MNFFLILPLFVGSAWLLLWRRLVISSKLSKGWTLLWTTVLFLCFFLQGLTPFLLRRGFFSDHVLLSTVSFSLLGFLDILTFYVLGKDVIYLLWKVAPTNPSRRQFVVNSLNLASLGLASGSAALGTHTAFADPQVKKISVPIKDLHKDLVGLRIVQISDLHAGPLIEETHVKKTVEIAQGLKPDIMVLTGDIADGHVESVKKFVAPLSQLQGKYGKFYVTGNHEYYWDVDAWTTHVESLGFKFLFNENIKIDIGRAGLLIAGVPDYSCQRIRPDHVSSPVLAMKGAPSSDFKILLAHQPKSCFEAAKAGFNLQLSGHTHDGQFFPNSLIIRFFHPYVKGLNLHENKLWVYVNSGTGFWGPPQRFGVPSEITCLTLEQV